MKKFATKPIASREPEPEESDPVEEFEAILAALPDMWAEPMPADAPAVDQPHWVILSFQLRAQKFEFLSALGLSTDDDMQQDGRAFGLILDGRAPAKRTQTRLPFATKPIASREPEPEESDDRPMAGLQARARAEADRFGRATQTTYWIAFCYSTPGDRERVAAALCARGARSDGFRFCGNDVARSLGIALPEAPAWKEPPVRARWNRFVRRS